MTFSLNRMAVTVLLLLIFKSNLYATIVTGKISDDKGEALSYATVIIKGTTQGATANGDGKYTLTLNPGSYTLVFQYVGFTPKTKQVEVGNTTVTLDVQLQTQQMELKEIVVNSDAEDPAYRVIRAAIKKRKYFLNQVDAYSCKVYIKGIQKLDSIPKHIMGLNPEKLGLDSSMLGIVYLSESESEYNFKQPDRIREIMFSSKVSGDNKAFSWNQASDFDFNFYKNLLDIGSLSDRGFVSPISESAMLYYKYKLIGTFYENNELVNKIQVIPRRKSDPVFSGYIYIVEDSWRIHSTDMLLTKDANIDFVDSFEVKQLFASLNDSVYMPINQTFVFQFTAFGIKGNGQFIGSFTNYNINPEFPKKFFKGETLKVNDDSNKKDSLYWAVNRPIPLTQEEMNDYRKKDSLAKLQNSKPYLDSLDRKRNKFGPGDLITGYNHYRRASKTGYGTSSALTFLNFNTVQGFAPELTLYRNKDWEDNRRMNAAIKGQYGLSDQRAGVTVRFSYLYKPVRFRQFSVEGGSYVRQLNESKPISTLVNSGYTLFYEQNFMKLYQNSYGKATWQSELMNGLKMNASVSYNHREPLINTNNFSFNEREGNNFTSNFPYSLNADSNFTAYNSLITSFTFTINFKQQYYTRPYEKVIVGSKYPTLKIKYNRGWNVLNSSVNFDQVEAEVTDEFKLGLLGKSTYSLSAGIFLNNKSVGFVELKQFRGNQTIFGQSDHLHAFQLLPYYAIKNDSSLIRVGTDQWFAEGHYEHHFNGFILNKFPLLRKFKWYEVASAHYLITPDIRYAELDLGIEHIFKIIRVDWVNSYSNELKLKSGFLIGIDLGGAIQFD
ncbi:MAG: DUF5686 and carboxypeptidase regulatory-like domain-containing protein [Bacteroidota bacterium]